MQTCNRAVSNFIVPFERPDYATRNSVSLTKNRSSYNNVVIQEVWFGFVKVALEVFNHLLPK